MHLVTCTALRPKEHLMAAFAFLAQTGAEGVDAIMYIGGGLLLAGVAVAILRIFRRKTKDESAE